jgi:hypothetical protein
LEGAFRAVDEAVPEAKDAECLTEFVAQAESAIKIPRLV